MKYTIQTFGCQMNEHESEILAGMMEDINYHPSDNLEECDAIIFNTCCIRESAENKILGRLGELKKLKRAKPHLIIAVCGCMVQQPDAADRVLKRAPHVDIILGTHNIHRLPQMINQVINGEGPIIEIWESEGEITEDLPITRQGKLKSYVTVMYGCNNFCTYCIVPYVRGRERSRHAVEIKKEIETLGREGFKEVMLLGQNVNSYGLDLQQKMDFADLLKMLDVVPGVKRIRYMTSHPRDFSHKLVDTIASLGKVCEQFHLPIQAGSNRILDLMNRGYTRETYLDLVEYIRSKIPQCSITTDIIVGFPGETEEDFQETLDIVKQVRFDAAYTFLYSPRSGTPAASLPNQLSMEEKKKRLQSLMKIQNDNSLAINKGIIGRNVEVLVEGVSKTSENTFSGRTRTNKVVVFPGQEDLIGRLVTVKIEDAKTWHLEGKII